MNPFDLLGKLLDNPRTSGGAIAAAVGIWLLTTYGVGPEGDVTIKYVALFMACAGVLIIGFGAADARNVVTKTEAAMKPPEQTVKFGDLAKDAPPGPKPVDVRVVNTDELHSDQTTLDKPPGL